MSNFVKNLPEYLHGSKIYCTFAANFVWCVLSFARIKHVRDIFFSVVNALECCSRLRKFLTLNNPK